jgi:hypothetical protein
MRIGTMKIGAMMIRLMRKHGLAAAFVLTATAAALAQTGFNPGTVVGNVYEKLPPGTGFGLGSSAAGYGYNGSGAGAASQHSRKWRHHHRAANGTSGSSER